MKLAYDYNNLIDEIKEEIEDLLLSTEDTIQILRAEESIGKDYYPIIDWYYIHDIVMDDLIVEPGDSKKEIALKKEIEAQYQKDQPNLVSMNVGDVLKEIEAINQTKSSGFEKFYKK